MCFTNGGEAKLNVWEWADLFPEGVVHRSYTATEPLINPELIESKRAYAKWCEEWEMLKRASDAEKRGWCRLNGGFSHE